jgi:hypothetical protein
MGSAFNSKVHFNETTSLDVDSGGQIVMADGAQMGMSVLGSTVFASTEVGTGSTFYNTGTILLTQNQTTTPRTFTVQAPIEGCHLDIIVASTASTDCQIDFNLGSGVGVLNAGTTSQTWIIASTDKSPSTYRSLSLVGLSTSLWGVLSCMPSSTGWLFAASSS